MVIGLTSDDVDDDGWIREDVDGIRGGLRGAMTISRGGLIFQTVTQSTTNKKKSNTRYTTMCRFQSKQMQTLKVREYTH